MNTINRIIATAALGFVFGSASAEMVRNPIGVNVSASRSMSLTVRFADTNGGTFTTTEALFCFQLLDNGQCDPASILGKLPDSRDRGSTLTPISSITDVMTIPYSVIRSAVARAQQVDYSDFFYVRRFAPSPGVDLGAGPGQDVFSRVTCHLAGPARIPLSLTKVALYGREADIDRPVRLIRINTENHSSGMVEARVVHTGTGILDGYWEVRQPGDSEVAEIDLFPEAALSESQRGLQQRFTRVKRFRVTATTTGVVIIPGPLYSQLPQNMSGWHELLLRFDATPGRENRSRLEVPGEPLNLFSGAVAGFKIPTLEYLTPAGLEKVGPVGNLAARLVFDDTDAEPVWRLGWRQQPSGLVVRFNVGAGDRLRSVIAPAENGILEFRGELVELLPDTNMEVALLAPDGSLASKSETVSVPNTGMVATGRRTTASAR